MIRNINDVLGQYPLQQSLAIGRFEKMLGYYRIGIGME